MNVVKLDSMRVMSPTYQRGFSDGHKLGFQEGKHSAEKWDIRTSMLLMGAGVAIGAFWREFAHLVRIL